MEGQGGAWHSVGHPAVLQSLTHFSSGKGQGARSSPVLAAVEALSSWREPLSSVSMCSVRQRALRAEPAPDASVLSDIIKILAAETLVPKRQ